MTFCRFFWLFLVTSLAAFNICIAAEKNEGNLEVKSELLRPCIQDPSYDCVKVDVLLHIDAPMDIVWQVITDYKHAAHFITNLKSSKEMTLAPNVLMVEQIGRVGWGLLNINIKTMSKVTLNPETKKIHSASVGGDLLTVTMSTQLKSRANGGSSLEYCLIIDPGPWAPLAISEELLKRHALQSFNDLKLEILKRNSINPNFKL